MTMMRSLAAGLILLAATRVECADRVTALARPLEPPQSTSQSGGFATALQTFTRGGPSTTNNDDSCDIALLPAATLLLPYFEVDLAATSGRGETTLLSITNTSAEERIALVTLWTDYSYPVLTFNIYLTGYDVQSINLFDVIAKGELAPPRGTSPFRSPEGALSRLNPALDTSACGFVPVFLPEIYLTRMRRAFTEGVLPEFGGYLPECRRAGQAHANAIGYATIDVVGSCTPAGPESPGYFESVIRYDNVLIGDYQQINGLQEQAQGGPLVHIRAVPEEGTEVNLPRTFYSRFQPASNKTRDRRQPLPSVFAARWISGGSGQLQTDLKIWIEGGTGPGAACSDYARLNFRQVTEAVTFDQEENAVGRVPEGCTVTCIEVDFAFPSTGRFPVKNGEFPELRDDTSGWIYLNLNTTRPPDVTQGWVISSMRAEGRYSIETDALALANGCTPGTPVTEVDPQGNGTIGPGPNAVPRKP